MPQNIPADPDAAAPLRVVLADRFPLVRQGLRNTIAQSADVTVVGEAANGPETLRLVHQLRPDVVVLDVQLPGYSGVEVTRHLRGTWADSAESHPPSPPQILVFTGYADRQYVWALLAAGARGYLLKDEPLTRVVAAIRQVAAGQTALSDSLQTMLVDLLTGLQRDLTPRELDVLRLVARGLDNAAVAERLALSERAVAEALQGVFRKLPTVRNRAEAVAWAWINHLVPEPGADAVNAPEQGGGGWV